MKYYKDEQTNEVFAFADDGSQDEFIRGGLIPMTQAEVEAHLNPPPSPEEIEARKVALVQRHMDEAARALRYDSIANAVTYAEEPAVPNFQAEGQAFRAWRSLVWAKCYAILDEVNAGTRDIPTDEELIAELPPLELPKLRRRAAFKPAMSLPESV